MKNQKDLVDEIYNLTKQIDDLGVENLGLKRVLERVRELPDSWRRDIHHPLDELRTFGSDHQAPWQLQDAWLRGEAALLNCIDDLTKALGEDKCRSRDLM